MSSLIRIEGPIEVPPRARPRGVIYLHGIQLERALAVGDRVQFQDEGGTWLTTLVVDVTHHRLGPRYRLQLLDDDDHPAQTRSPDD